MEATVLDHPLCQHKLTIIRDVKTPGSLFRRVIEELGLILAVEGTRHLATEPVAVETPLERTQGRRLTSLDPVLVPVLRAGLGLLPPFLQLLPTAKVGQAAAILAIKNVLSQHRPVVYSYYLSTGADWQAFFSFWDGQPETALWNPDPYSGHTYDPSSGGGHLVTIVGYDENLWARTYDYHAHDVELAFRTVEAVRANTVALLRRLPDSAFGRMGRHTESGAYTDADWFRIYAEHLEVHAAQIRRNLSAWQAAHNLV